MEEVWAWAKNAIASMVGLMQENLKLRGEMPGDADLIPKLAEMYRENAQLRSALQMERGARKRLELAYRKIL